MSFAEHIPSIITATGTIILGWFTYNQYTKNKLTDMKVDKMQAEQIERQKRSNKNISIIYGELWRLLHELEASRVIILQPHPLGNNVYITMTYEVLRTGISSVKDSMQKVNMSSYAKMCADLATRDFILFQDIEKDCSDKRFRAVTQTNGVESLMVKRLTDEVHDWTGSLFVDWSDREYTGNIDQVKARINKSANAIQYILPEIM